MTPHNAKPASGTGAPRRWARAALIALTSALFVPPALAQADLNPVLGGTTGGFTWAVYGIDDYQAARAASERDLTLINLPGGKIVGAKYADAELIFVTRFPAERLEDRVEEIQPEDVGPWLYHHYERQFIDQGFRRLDGRYRVGEDSGRAVFERDDVQVEFLYSAESNNLYRIRLNMLGAVR